jgi:hypothetical protein
MLFCMSRAVEVCYALLERHGYVRSVKYGEVFVFAVALSILLGIDRQDFKPVYRKILDFLFGREPSSGAPSPDRRPPTPKVAPLDPATIVRPVDDDEEPPHF